ncbi:PLD nuclease N-terminal domain-containing protein [Leucobacter sp. NPDC077196]|uniref:PLD nuclease N-terminal domain-containing protein n=1 Tax=Leucobacter sp. NPDC077196 TaxID=3154959 RepID=UPI003414D23C
MVRFVIIGVVIAVALTLYALVDAAMTEGSRARGMNKPVWIVIIAVLPVIGALLWFFIGKGAAQAQTTRRPAPDDDPRFSGTRLTSTDLDAHMRDLEDRLRELDDETFPGEEHPAVANGDRGGVDGADRAVGGDASTDAASTDAASMDAASMDEARTESASPADPQTDSKSVPDRKLGSTSSPTSAGATHSGSPKGEGDEAGAAAADDEASNSERPERRGAEEPGTRSDGDAKP